MLVSQGLVTPAQVNEALKVQAQKGGKTFEILIELGHLDKDRLHTFLSKQPGVASIDLKNYHINRELLAMIPKEFAVTHMLLPIDKMGRLLTVGMACPLDSTSIAEVERVTGLKVKAMLCRLDDIHAAVKQYYPDDRPFEEKPTVATFNIPAGGPRQDEAAGTSLPQVESLPIAASTFDLLEGAAKKKPDIHKLVEIVSRDPMLAALILARTNSPLYGFAGKINSIPAALALMGAEAACACGLGAGKLTQDGFDVAAFIDDALFCARAAESIAAKSGAVNPALAYAAGLLCRVGRVAIWSANPQKAAKIDAQLTGLALARAEKQAVNMSHSDVGYSLAKKWAYPAALSESIRYYLTPEKATEAKELTAAVALGSLLAQARGVDDASRAALFEKSGDMLKILKFDKAGVQKLLQEMKGNAS